MLRSWRVGRAFGIDVYVHWSFWILPIAFIVLTKSYGLVQTPLALTTILLAITCVVLHELGHALAARLFGIRTRDIILFPLGGVARLERMSEKPIEEIIIALAGPAVNVVLAAMIMVGALATEGARFFEGDPPDPLQFTSARMIVHYLFGWNVLMVLFNLAPAFPMDGGRVLRAFLALFFRRITATRIAVYFGMGVAGVFILIGIGVPKFFMLILAGLFVMVLGPLELAMLQRQEELRRQAVEDAALSALDEEAIVPLAPPEPDFSGYSWNPHLRAWIEWRQGRPVRQYRMRVG